MITEEKKKRRILVVDSEKRQIQRIAESIFKVAKDLYIEVEIRAARNIEDAHGMLMEDGTDVLILDTIYKGGKRGEYPGLTFVKRIRGISKYEFLPVIFISSIAQPERYAYLKLNCLRFLRREFDRKELESAMKKALIHQTGMGEEKYLVFRKQGMVYPVKIENIRYIETKEHQIYVHVQDGENLQIPHMTLANIKNRIPITGWIQCNRYTLVNRKYVEKMDTEEGVLLIKGQQKGQRTKIKIGRKYWDGVNSKFKKKTGIVRMKKLS